MFSLTKISILIISLASVISETYPQGHWRILARPTSKDLYRLCFLDSLRGWIVGEHGTIMKTTDGGQNWMLQESNVREDIIDIYMVNERLGWALAHIYPADTGSVYGTILLKTTNGGNQWNTNFFQDNFFFSIFFHDSLYGWMGGLFGALVGTSNGGSTWFQANVDSSVFMYFPIVKIKFFSRQYGYALGGRMDITGVIWRTVNYGQNWSAAPIGPEPIFDLYYIDSLNILCVSGDFDVGSSLVKTTDGGVNWEYIYLGIWGQARALTFRTRAEGWSPLGFPGTYMYTLDSGRTWTDIYTPDSSAVFDAIFTDSLTGYMVGEQGTILKYNQPIVNVNNGSAFDKPQTNTLYQNYPNPFNPTTEIRYQITDIRWVRLRVFDVLGREVVTLVDGFQFPGEYTVTWDASGLPSGMYFCRLTTGDYMGTRKMVLMR